jgi:hypothetical protein
LPGFTDITLTVWLFDSADPYSHRRIP